jgi:hypothetical protein
MSMHAYSEIHFPIHWHAKDNNPVLRDGSRAARKGKPAQAG